MASTHHLHLNTAPGYRRGVTAADVAKLVAAGTATEVA